MRCFFPGVRGRRVEGIGPLGAKVLLVGEAPGKDEDQYGEPFVGAAGKFLWTGRDWNGQTEWPGLEQLGLPREDVRIENVVELRPQDNYLWRMSPDQIRQWQGDFWARVEKLSGPNVVVPMGNLALNTLRRTPLPVTKKGTWRIRKTPQGPQIDWADKISNWRGSIFRVRAENGTPLKVVPLFHPSYLLRSGQDYDCWRGDWDRVLGDAEFSQLRLDPRCEHFIEPTARDAHAFRMQVHAAHTKDPRGAIMACDIETLAYGRVVDCIGFSIDPSFSMTVNLREPWAWAYVRSLLLHPIAKGWHFGLYDLFQLWRKGVRVENSRWDTHQLHHGLDPRDEHSLAYCASRDLRVRYWKHENKEEGKSTMGRELVRDPKKRWRYNGKDACYTRALLDIYIERYRERKWLPLYRDHYRRLSAACFRLAQTGFQVDDQARLQIEAREDELVASARAGMLAVAGQDMVAKKGLASKRVTTYFYDTLKCKPFYRRGTGTRTADELAIRRLMRRYKKARPMGEKILQFRSHAKIRQEVRSSIVSDDGRLRSRYTPTADTGRLRAAKISELEGINSQNRDRHSDLRRMFTADRGHVLVEVDQSQAEDRLASGMSGLRAAQKVARLRPDAIDNHVANACKIFPEWTYEKLLRAYRAGDEEANEKRQLGKRTKYAVWYGMGGFHMAEVTLVETEGKLVLDPDECDAWIKLMVKAEPAVPIYQSWIRQSLQETRSLRSSWGREVYFRGLRLGKEDYKAAYAWLPQHECGVLTNQGGFVPLDEALQAGRFRGARIVQQGHDSLIVTSPPRYAYGVAQFLSKGMGAERTYGGAGGAWTLAMPIGVKVGHNWKEMQEWKELPAQDVFERAMKRYI